MQEAQTGRRETENREARQIRQSEGNKAARRLFTASPKIRGACDFPFGMLSQLLLKTGLLLETSDPAGSSGVEAISTTACSLNAPSIYQLESPY
jgi:hypothetical protein